MNPDFLDLSTWRAEAPSYELQARVFLPRRRAVLPRLGLVGAVAAVLVVAATLGTAPVRAEALVARAGAKAVELPGHATITDYAGGVPVGSRGEVWFAPGVQRLILRYPASGGHPAEVFDSLSVRIDAATTGPAADLVRREAKAGRLEGIQGRDTSRSREGTFSISVRSGELRVNRRQDDFEITGFRVIAENNPEGAPWRYREGQGTVGHRVVYAENAGPRRFVFAIDRASERLVSATREMNPNGHWLPELRVEFDHASSVDPSRFDPSTLQ